MAGEHPSQTPSLVQEQAAGRATQQRATELIRQLHQDAESLLIDKGRSHTYWGDVTIHVVMLPLMPLKLPELMPLQRAHRRFMEMNQARYIGRPTQDGNSGVLLMANDGDPRRANRMQFEVWDGNELLVLDDASGRIGVIEGDPRYDAIEPSINFHGTRNFDHKRFKYLRGATEEDAEKYQELIGFLRNPNAGGLYITSLYPIGRAQ